MDGLVARAKQQMQHRLRAVSQPLLEDLPVDDVAALTASFVRQVLRFRLSPSTFWLRTLLRLG